MAERFPDSRETEQGPEYEAAMLVDINQAAQIMFDIADRAGVDVGDGIFDSILFLGQAMTRRDPTFGHILVGKLQQRAAENLVDHHPTEAEANAHLAQQIERELANMPSQELPPQEPPAAPGT